MTTCTLGLLALALLTGAEAQQRENKLPDSALAVLTKADQFELLSLKPDEKEKAQDGFHGYPVLGTTAVKDADTRKQLVESLTKGMEGKIDPARCFIPRHGVRATHDGKTVELVICFECAQFLVHAPGAAGKRLLVNKTPEPLFDKVLKEAGIPKAK
jgi:hypothetical protein